MRLIKFLSFSILLFIFGCSFHSSKQQLNLKENFISRNDNSTINYYLINSNLSQPSPITLLIHGSQCDSALNSSYNKLNLKKYPSIFLFIEKYGIDKNTKTCPDEYLKNNSSDQRTEDILIVLNKLRKKELNWNGDINIVAGSEGGVIAAKAANRINGLNKLALIATGGGMIMADWLMFSMIKSMKSTNAPQNIIDQHTNELTEQIKEIKNSKIKSKTMYGKNNSYHYWRSMLWYNQADHLINLNNPILLIHGTEDINCPVESARKMQEVFKNNNKSNLIYWELEDLDHVLLT